MVFLADICTAATWDSLWLVSQGQFCSVSGAALTTFSGERGGMKEDTSCVTWLYDFRIVAKVIFLWLVILTAQHMSLCDFVGVFLQPVRLALRLCTCT